MDNKANLNIRFLWLLFSVILAGCGGGDSASHSGAGPEVQVALTSQGIDINLTWLQATRSSSPWMARGQR